MQAEEDEPALQYCGGCRVFKKQKKLANVDAGTGMLDTAISSTSPENFVSAARTAELARSSPSWKLFPARPWNCIRNY